MPLLPLPQLGVGLGIHETRVRVEGLQHAVDRAVDDPVGLDRLHILLLDLLERRAEDVDAFRQMWRFFSSFSNDLITFMPRIEDTFSMYLRMMIGMAVVFQMPALVFFLARMGVVTARWMARQFKYAVLVIVVLAAIITPSSDVASQLIVAGPMVILYVLSIAIAWAFGKKRVEEV